MVNMVDKLNQENKKFEKNGNIINCNNIIDYVHIILTTIKKF